MTSPPDRIIVAAAITAAGAIIAAYISRQIIQEVRLDDTQVAQLRAELLERDKALAELRASLEARNQVAGASPASPSQSSRIGSPPSIPAEKLSFRFILEGCVLRYTSLICDLLIINLGPKRDLLFSRPLASPPSRLFDDGGNEHFASHFRLGAAEGEAAQATMPIDIPVRAVVSFAEVRSGISGVRLLELGCTTWSHGLMESFTVEFKNPPLSKGAV